jgi:hypothetical protein
MRQYLLLSIILLIFAVILSPVIVQLLATVLCRSGDMKCLIVAKMAIAAILWSYVLPFFGIVILFGAVFL